MRNVHTSDDVDPYAQVCFEMRRVSGSFAAAAIAVGLLRHYRRLLLESGALLIHELAALTEFCPG